MAHEIDNTKGFNAMAYVGDKPWHGLGQQMKKGQSIEQWQTAAGMDFEIHQVPALYQIKEGGFTRPIGAQNPQSFARNDIKAEVICDVKRSEVFGDTSDL